MPSGSALGVSTLLHTLLSLLGLVVCAIYIRRTPWAALLALSFAVELGVRGFYSYATGLPRPELLGVERHAAILVVSWVALVGKAAFVVGLWGLMQEAGRRTVHALRDEGRAS